MVIIIIIIIIVVVVVDEGDERGNEKGDRDDVDVKFEAEEFFF